MPVIDIKSRRSAVSSRRGPGVVVDLRSYITLRKDLASETIGRSSLCAKSTTGAGLDCMGWGLRASFGFIGLLAIANMGFWSGYLRTWQNENEPANRP